MLFRSHRVLPQYHPDPSEPLAQERVTNVKNRCQQAFSTNVEIQEAGIHELCIVIKSFNRRCLEFPYVLCQSLQRLHHSATAMVTRCCVLKAASLSSRPRLWWPWGCRSRQWWWLGLSGIRSRVCESAARQRHHTLILHTTAERGRRQAPPALQPFFNHCQGQVRSRL